MKKFPVFLLCIWLISGLATGQQLQKIRKIVPVMSQQSFYLNGGIRSAFGGKSRVTYQVTLPPNTIEWYYTFTTTDQGNSAATLNLIPQLTRLLDPSGVTSILASAILSPTGSHSCDIYLFDKPNNDAFLEKVDNNGGNFACYVSASRQNYRNGVINVKDITSGILYLGFKNPSETEGIGVSFEVAAIVEETVVNNAVWSQATKERFYNLFYQALKSRNIDEAMAKDLTGCLVEKIAVQKTPGEYDQMTAAEREAYVTGLYTACVNRYNLARTPEQQKAAAYGDLGWKAYENGDIDKCIELSKKALAYDAHQGVVKANLGLCYLVKGQEDTATDFYVDALSDIKAITVRPAAQQHLKGIVNDLNNVLLKYPGIKGAAYIKGIFETELKNY